MAHVREELSRPRTTDPLASLRIDRSERPRRGAKWTTIAVVLLLVAAAGGGGAYLWLRFGANLLATQVTVATVEVREAGASGVVLSAQGYLESRQQAAIGPTVPGRIFKMFIEEGQTVEQGALLAELEHDDLDALLEAMGADLDRSKAELEETETMLAQTRRDHERTTELYRRKGVSGEEFENSLAKLEGTQRRRDALEAAVKAAEAHLRRTEQQRDDMFVRAPFAGTVISKEAEVGETIMMGGMGMGSGRGSVVTLADLNHLEVDTDVKEDYISRIRPGQEAIVAPDAVRDRRYKGRVRAIIPMGDRARGTIKVKVEILDPDGRLFPETAATVRFLGEGTAAQGGAVVRQLFVPSAAVRKDDSGEFVWQLTGDRVRRVHVQTGQTDGDRVEVTRGLNGNEQVVVNPPDSLKEDARVRLPAN